MCLDYTVFDLKRAAGRESAYPRRADCGNARVRLSTFEFFSIRMTRV